jgi:AcrR family transcriptional regulator
VPDLDRLTGDDYVREALVVLGDYGVESMTIAVLCQRLEVTKGSFYHHFVGMPGFVAALLAYWEREHSDRLIAISKAQPDPALRLSGLVDLAVGLPHAPEAAMRAWGRSNPEVAEVVARVDKRRERHLTDAIVAIGVGRPRARVLTRLAVNTLVGTQVREERVDTRRLRLMLDELVQMVYRDADPELVARARAAG